MKAFLKVMRGSLKNKVIPLPPAHHGHQNATPAKMKEAAFQIMENHIIHPEKSVFLDLFAGSGQMGMEAISRGFLKTWFSEMESNRITDIRSWLIKHSVTEKGLVMHSNSFKKLLTFVSEPPELTPPASTLDLIIFADPPYLESAPLKPAFTLVDSLVKLSSVGWNSGLLMVQVPNSRRREIPRADFERLSAHFTRVYGYGKNSLLVRELSPKI